MTDYLRATDDRWIRETLRRERDGNRPFQDEVPDERDEREEWLLWLHRVVDISYCSHAELNANEYLNFLDETDMDAWDDITCWPRWWAVGASSDEIRLDMLGQLRNAPQDVQTTALMAFEEYLENNRKDDMYFILRSAFLETMREVA